MDYTYGVTKSQTRLSDFRFHTFVLEREMATHSSVLAWRISWTEEPDGLQSTGLQRVGHDLRTRQQYMCVCVCVCVRARACVCEGLSLIWVSSSGAFRPLGSLFPPAVFVKSWASQRAPALSPGELK